MTINENNRSRVIRAALSVLRQTKPVEYSGTAMGFCCNGVRFEFCILDTKCASSNLWRHEGVLLLEELLAGCTNEELLEALL